MHATFAEPTTHHAGDDLDRCRRLLKGGSRSFHAASFLLPRQFGDSACALYAFCRLADDAIDGEGDSQLALQELNRRLDRIYVGHPADHAADRALWVLARDYQLPKALLQALFEGFSWDAQGRRYESLSDVLAYGARVAGAVGVMMAVLMGTRTPSMLARAADLGVAMQLTNIARDVGEDARAGRLYLPASWMCEAGLDPDRFLAEPVFSEALGTVVGRLLNVADSLYRRADSGIAFIPISRRPGMYAARLLYAQIGRELTRRGLDSVSRRTVVSALGKARVLARLPTMWTLDVNAIDNPPLTQTRFLVEAASTASPVVSMPRARTGILNDMERQFVWVIDLFEELDRRDVARTSATGKSTG
jgi:15-cis-phytoene synthase